MAQLPTLPSAPAEDSSFTNGKCMQSSTWNHIKDMPIACQDASFRLSPHMKQTVDEDSRMFIPTANVKIIFVSINCHFLHTNSLLQINFFFIMSS